MKKMIVKFALFRYYVFERIRKRKPYILRLRLTKSIVALNIHIYTYKAR